MKQLGKIGVFLFSLMILMNVFAFINLELNGVYRFGGAIPALITFGFSWFISYSKWANNNIWNRKKSKPTNESINPINPTNPNDDNNALQKIEELKRQIENIEQSLKNNDTNSETESPELSEEDFEDKLNADEKRTIVLGIIIVIIVIAIFVLYDP